MSNELRFSLNCDKRPEWLDSDKSQSSVDGMTLIGEPFIPINPDTKKPYLQSVFEGNDAVWVGRKVTPRGDADLIIDGATALELDRNYVANANGEMINERGEVCGSIDYETGKVRLVVSCNRVLINPPSE